MKRPDLKPLYSALEWVAVAIAFAPVVWLWVALFHDVLTGH
jgi:hypothetical protein